MSTLALEQETVKTVVKSVKPVRNVSENKVVYFPFETEEETADWMEYLVSEWWDDETI